MNKIECPYCEHRYEIVPEEFMDLPENEDYEEFCPACGKRFLYYVTYEVTYWPRQADCLNGGEHDYIKRYLLPEFPIELKCRICGKIKKGDQA